MSRAGDRLTALDGRLSARDREVVEAVGRMRLLSASQLERLCFAEIPERATRQRRVRRVLGRLAEQGVLYRLARRVGGVRAGSAGTVWRLAPEGERLRTLWHGEGVGRPRGRYEPGSAYVAHTLAVADLYVRLVEAERAGGVEIIEHQAEPECWRSYLGLGGRSLTLRPDSYVRLGVGDFELRTFVEVDRGTVGSLALERKHRAYLDYYRSGAEQAAHGNLPMVLWVAGDQRRVQLLDGIATSLGDQARRVFEATTTASAIDLLGGAPDQEDAA